MVTISSLTHGQAFGSAIHECHIGMLAITIHICVQKLKRFVGLLRAQKYQLFAHHQLEQGLYAKNIRPLSSDTLCDIGVADTRH